MSSARQGEQRSRARTASGTIMVAAALVLAACSKSVSTPGAAPPASASPSAAPAVSISAVSVPWVGTVLVNPAGVTLYILTTEQGGTIACTGSCTQAWPPVVLPGSSSGAAGSGVQASLLGVVNGAAGTRQLTYGGWPLHTFAGDTSPGVANGEGIVSFGGTWEALAPAGTPVPPPSPSPSPAPKPSPAATKAAVVPPAPSPTHAVVPASPSPVVAPSPSPTVTSPQPVPTYSYGY